MGALTLKSFPFELRKWDTEKFESIDPTDGFGSNTKVSINRNKIIQIEPDYDSHTFNSWLTDKGRQFFDGMLRSPKSYSLNENTKTDIADIFKNLIQTLYIFDHCSKQNNKVFFFTIVFENLSLEVLSILLMISKNYSFIKLRRAENLNINNDLESNFQLNLSKHKLNSSDLCLLISNNPRYEGYYLNLNLRQRFLKGNFKCLSIGSLIDLTFPVSFLGSNFKILKDIGEGKSLTCQDLKFSKNLIFVFNNELFKRNNSENVLEIVKFLKYSNILNKTWNGSNILNPSLKETGTQALAKLAPFTTKDLNFSGSLYFLNVATNNLPNLKKIINTKLLNVNLSIPSMVLDHNINNNNHFSFFNHLNPSQKYFYLPHDTFYENEETFISTDGFIKRTTKLILKKKAKNNWQILRKFNQNIKKDLLFLDRNNNHNLDFNSKKIVDFKNFINFHYYATQTLTNLSFYISIKTQPFVLSENIPHFRQKTVKINNTKVKYWLDDFFSGGKDEYSQNSVTLNNCSRILRSESTNFF